MRLLLDTHSVIWATLDPQALSIVERRLMADAAGPLVLSSVAVWASADLRPPLPHGDLFDELLLVQAREEGMRLLTRHMKLVGHPLAVAARDSGSA